MRKKEVQTIIVNHLNDFIARVNAGETAPLYFNCIKTLDKPMLIMLAGSLKRAKNTEIKLIFEDCLEDDTQIKILAESLKYTTIKKIDFILGDNNIGDNGAIAFASALFQKNCPELYLDFRNNGIGVKGTNALMEGLKNKSCPKVRINLEGNILGNTGAALIAKTIQSGKWQPSYLNLSRNQMSDKGAKALAEALQYWSSPELTLDLSGNYIGLQGIKALAKSLANSLCPKIRLALRYNSINDKGAQALAEALSSDRCPIIDLDLSHNDIGNVGAKAFAKAFKNRRHLKVKLNLKHNKMFREEGALAITQELLKKAVSPKDGPLWAIKLDDETNQYFIDTISKLYRQGKASTENIVQSTLSTKVPTTFSLLMKLLSVNEIFINQTLKASLEYFHKIYNHDFYLFAYQEFPKKYHSIIDFVRCFHNQELFRKINYKIMHGINIDNELINFVETSGNEAALDFLLEITIENGITDTEYLFDNKIPPPYVVRKICELGEARQLFTKQINGMYLYHQAVVYNKEDLLHLIMSFCPDDIFQAVLDSTFTIAAKNNSWKVVRLSA